MVISSLSDLKDLELKIEIGFRKLKLGNVLYSLRLLKETSPDLQPFVVAGVALFAARFCDPSKVHQKIKNHDIRSLVSLSKQYYLTDPIVFDKDLENEFMNSNPAFMMLRLRSSQFPFDPDTFSSFSRPAFLFHEIPRQLQSLPGIPQFDLESNFQAVTGVSVIDFITTGFVIASACRGQFAVNQNYFRKLREQGIELPNDQNVRLIINQIAVDKIKLIEIYESRKVKDERFKMYSFNPLLSHPLIKPCQNKQFSKPNEDFIHAPLPELVDLRISTGIFYQMFNSYKTRFSQYFGHVFESYVGIVLKNCITSEELLSESDIREFYPISDGRQVPDWILIDGSTLILFECKATRFSRAAQETASEDAVNDSLKQVVKGLHQLDNFISACRSNVSELKRFHDCTAFKSVLVSLESLSPINNPLFREHIDTLLAVKDITGLDWQMRSVSELEVLQPHTATGLRLSQVLDELLQKNFDEVLRDLASQTKKTFVHSFLYQKHEELYQRLKLADKVS